MNVDDILKKYGGSYIVEQPEKDEYIDVDVLQAMPEEDDPLDAILSKYGAERTESSPAQRKSVLEGMSNGVDDPLKKDDLLAPENLRIIKNYMGQRYGRDALKEDDEQIVESFVDSMRWFNTNVASTVGEARYIINADEEKKGIAGQAYNLYDRLDNVFVNDGFMGAVDGVKDYIFAAATDPTNFLGLLTGGTAKAAAVGVGAGGKKLIQAAAKKAGEEALKKGFSKKAQKEAVKKAVADASKELTKRAIREPARKDILKKAAMREKEIYEFTLKRKGEQAFMDERAKKFAKKGLMGTTAIDASAALLQDVMIQNTLIEAGAQEKYSATQTAFSSLLGGVGGAIHLAGMGLKDKSGLAGVAADVDIGKKRRSTMDEIDLLLSKAEAKKAANAVRKVSSSWKAKIARAKTQYEDVPTSVDLIKDIMFGEDGNSGVVGLYIDRGIKIPKRMTVSDLMTSMVKSMDEKDLMEINKDLAATGIKLGEMSEVGTNLQDLLALEISKAGQVLNVMSQARRTIDAGIVRGQKLIEEQTKEATEEAGDKAQYAKYAQSLWRRMLVSSPATSAVNLLGFAQYYGGTSIAEALNMTGLYASGYLKGGTKTKEGRATLRQASVYKDMITQKLRYLADPFTTRDAYMKILDEHEDMRKTLYDSLTGGIDLSAERYGINKKSKFFNALESTANGAAIVAGVRAQDSLTKSVMFMSELDKQVRLKHDQTLDSILRSGNMDLLDDEVMATTLDQTLKSVFSKDYTKGQNEVVEGVATLVETISRTPLLGTILPFGRFMNNVLASSYQWTAGGMIGYMGAVKRAAFDKGTIELSDTEALSRSLVGTTFLSMAVLYDEERQKEDLGTFDIKVGNRIVDAQNTFPMSLFLAAGRMLNDKRQGRDITADQWMSTMEQLAVGQLASDIQFKNDIRALGEAIFNQEGGNGKAMVEALASKGGNILAGYTRPLDAVNKMVGIVANNDAVRDPRQAEGIHKTTMAATKYTDNILEAILGELDSVTGETLRVATREGDLRDPNPFMSALGIRIREGRTAGEEILDQLDLPRYMANSRSEIAAYDRAFNETVAPLVNKYADQLLSDPEYQKASKADKRKIWKNVFNAAKSDIRDYLMEAPTEYHIEAVRKKAAAVPKDLKSAALKFLKEEEGFTGSIKDMTYPELDAFFTYIEFYKNHTDWTK